MKKIPMSLIALFAVSFAAPSFGADPSPTPAAVESRAGQSSEVPAFKPVINPESVGLTCPPRVDAFCRSSNINTHCENGKLVTKAPDTCNVCTC